MYNFKDIQKHIQDQTRLHSMDEILLWHSSLIINRFSRTKLSNFYPVRINYNNVIYPSVEHGYQSQKFKIDTLLQLTPEQFKIIEDELKLK